MTTRDQQAMNDQLTQLRKEGLSIDGDNLYKDDLIDVAIGAMLRGFQAGQEPPEGHWAWRFYEIGKAERDRLAELMADRDRKKARVEDLEGRICDLLSANPYARLTAMQGRLTEAEGLLDRVVTQVGRTITSELREEIDALLASHTEPAVCVHPEPVAHLTVEVRGRSTQVGIEWPNGLHTTLPAGEYPLYTTQGAVRGADHA